MALREAFERFGTFAGTLYLVNRAFDRVGLRGPFEYLAVVAQPVPADPISKRSAVGYRALTAYEQAPELFDSLPVPRQVILDRFAQGALCLQVTSKGRDVGTFWLCRDHYTEDVVRCVYTLDHGQQLAWDFDVYVPPERRGTLAFVYLWEAANSYYRENGIQWSCSRISMFNDRSMRSHQKLGARVLGKVLFLRLGALQLMVSSLGPPVHLSLGTSQPLIKVAVR